MYLALLLLPGLAGPHHTKLLVVVHEGLVPKRHSVELSEEEQDLVSASVGLVSHTLGYLQNHTQI